MDTYIYTCIIKSNNSDKANAQILFDVNSTINSAEQSDVFKIATWFRRNLLSAFWKIDD